MSFIRDLKEHHFKESVVVIICMTVALGTSFGLWCTTNFNLPISAQGLTVLISFYEFAVLFLFGFLISKSWHLDGLANRYLRCFFLLLFGITINSYISVYMLMIFANTLLPIISMSLLAATLLGIGSILLWGHVFPARRAVVEQRDWDGGPIPDPFWGWIHRRLEVETDGPQLRADSDEDDDFDFKGSTTKKEERIAGERHVDEEQIADTPYKKEPIAGERCDDEAPNGSPSDLYTPGDINNHW